MGDMKAFYQKAFKVFDRDPAISEAGFVEAMGGIEALRQWFPNARFSGNRVNDPERMIQTPRRIATRMPRWYRRHAIKDVPSGKRGTALAAAWEHDVANGVHARSLSDLRRNFPGSRFLLLLEGRNSGIRSVTELRTLLAQVELPPKLAEVIRWVVKDPGCLGLAELSELLK